MKLPAITKLNRDKMKVMAQFAIDLIRKDANDGIFQNDTGPHDYGSHGDTKGRSKKTDGNNKYKNGQKYLYPDYKARGMRRFKDGKKIKGFGAQSTDTRTSHVNMQLTGRTLRGIRAGARKDTAILRFDRGAVVMGNANRSPDGYDIYDLRPANQQKYADELARILEKTNIQKYLKTQEIMK
tara:strand:- start:288 stop:833 length:546 start_codon:yes stop_codon:yes gene_type:complete